MLAFRNLMLLPLIVAMPVMAQQASVVRDTDMKSEQFADAKTITVLKAKQKIDVGERRGGWYQAKSSDGKSGWLRLTAVLLSSTQGTGDSGVTSAKQLLKSGRSGSTGVTAATGVRCATGRPTGSWSPIVFKAVKSSSSNVDSCITCACLS